MLLDACTGAACLNRVLADSQSMQLSMLIRSCCCCESACLVYAVVVSVAVPPGCCASAAAGAPVGPAAQSGTQQAAAGHGRQPHAGEQKWELSQLLHRCLSRTSGWHICALLQCCPSLHQDSQPVYPLVFCKFCACSTRSTGPLGLLLLP